MNDTGFPSDSWRKSPHSGDSGDCVEVAAASAAIGIRDTKDRAGGALVLTRDAWAHFQRSDLRR